MLTRLRPTRFHYKDRVQVYASDTKSLDLTRLRPVRWSLRFNSNNYDPGAMNAGIYLVYVSKKTITPLSIQWYQISISAHASMSDTNHTLIGAHASASYLVSRRRPNGVRIRYEVLWAHVSASYPVVRWRPNPHVRVLYEILRAYASVFDYWRLI